MSDLVIDYGLLNQAATDIQNLSPEINRIKNSVRTEARGATVETVPGQVNANNPDLGPGNTLYRELGEFYAKWSGDMQNAMDSLDKMAGYFKGVADSFMETDASQASGMNESAMISAVLRYPLEMDEYNKEAAAAQKAGNAAPPAPPAPPSPFSLNAGGGPVTSYSTTADTDIPAADKATSTPNVVLSTETTTDTVDGLTYSETTTFSANQGWSANGPTQNTTQVVNNPDGSTDTVTTTTNTSGQGTMTDYNSSTKDTTTYTRADWNSSWVDTTPADTSSSSDSGSDNGVDPAPFVD